VAQPGVFTAVACPDCRQAVNATLGRCPACGQDMDPCLTSSPVSDAADGEAQDEP